MNQKERNSATAKFFLGTYYACFLGQKPIHGHYVDKCHLTWRLSRERRYEFNSNEVGKMFLTYSFKELEKISPSLPWKVHNVKLDFISVQAMGLKDLLITVAGKFLRGEEKSLNFYQTFVISIPEAEIAKGTPLLIRNDTLYVDSDTLGASENVPTTSVVKNEENSTTAPQGGNDRTEVTTKPEKTDVNVSQVVQTKKDTDKATKVETKEVSDDDEESEEEETDSGESEEESEEEEESSPQESQPKPIQEEEKVTTVSEIEKNLTTKEEQEDESLNSAAPDTKNQVEGNESEEQKVKKTDSEKKETAENPSYLDVVVRGGENESDDEGEESEEELVIIEEGKRRWNSYRRNDRVGNARKNTSEKSDVTPGKKRNVSGKNRKETSTKPGNANRSNYRGNNNDRYRRNWGNRGWGGQGRRYVSDNSRNKGNAGNRNSGRTVEKKKFEKKNSTTSNEKPSQKEEMEAPKPKRKVQASQEKKKTKDGDLKKKTKGDAKVVKEKDKNHRKTGGGRYQGGGGFDSRTHGIFVSNLHKDTSEAELKSCFDVCGKITEIHNKSEDKRIAFVFFSSYAGVDKAMKLGRETKLKCKSKVVTVEKRKHRNHRSSYGNYHNNYNNYNNYGNYHYGNYRQGGNYHRGGGYYGGNRNQYSSSSSSPSHKGKRENNNTKSQSTDKEKRVKSNSINKKNNARRNVNNNRK